jgi:hypothetical protein
MLVLVPTAYSTINTAVLYDVAFTVLYSSKEPVEGGSVNIIGVSRSEKILEKRDAENWEEAPAYLHGSWEYVGREPRFSRSPVFEIALFCTRYSRL